MVNVAGDNLSEARLAEPLCGVEHHLAQRLQDCFALIIFEAVISEVLSSFPQASSRALENPAKRVIVSRLYKFRRGRWLHVLPSKNLVHMRDQIL